MNVIHKYPINLRDDMPVSIQMPINAIVRHVGQQDNHDEVVLWAEHACGAAANLKKRMFYVAGTGHPTCSRGDYKLTFVGTVVSTISAFVWHVFEVDKPDVITQVMSW